MDRRIYLGEDERAFYLAFLRSVTLDDIATDDPDDDEEQDPPCGVVVVPKDYESCWLAGRKSYLGWKVVLAPVAKELVEGYDPDARWTLLKEAELTTGASGTSYFVFRRPDGKVLVETLSGEAVIAESVGEYESLTSDELERRVCAVESGGAR